MSSPTAVYLLFLVVTLAIGLTAGRRVRSPGDFHVAARRVGWPVLAGSFLASNASAGFFLGGTNMVGRLGYTFWFAYATTAVGMLFALAVVGVLVRRLAERHEIYSFADLLATRYPSRATALRSTAGFIISLVYLPYMAAQFIGLASITASVLDLPYEPVLAGIVVFVATYTLWGGMVGVVWTDTFQFLVLFLGMVVAAPLAVRHLGGGSAAVAWGRLLHEMPSTIFQATHADWPPLAVAGQALWLFAASAQPHLLTRFLTARDERTIVKTVPIVLVAFLVLYASSLPVGLAGRLMAPDLPAGGYYYIELARVGLGAWLGGFALAAIAAAALSTCSTELIITSQTLSRDLYHRRMRPTAGARELVIVSRLSVLVVAALTLGLAHGLSLGIFWLVFLAVSLLTASFFVPVVLGLLSPAGSGTAALGAMIAGAVVAVGAYGVNQAMGLGEFSIEAFAGLAASLVVYLTVSRRVPPDASERQVAASLALDGWTIDRALAGGRAATTPVDAIMAS